MGTAANNDTGNKTKQRAFIGYLICELPSWANDKMTRLPIHAILVRRLFHTGEMPERIGRKEIQLRLSGGNRRRDRLDFVAVGLLSGFVAFEPLKKDRTNTSPRSEQIHRFLVQPRRL